MSQLVHISSIKNSILDLVKKPKILSFLIQNTNRLKSILQPLINSLSPFIIIISKLKLILTPFVWIFTIYSFSKFISSMILLLLSAKTNSEFFSR